MDRDRQIQAFHSMLEGQTSRRVMLTLAAQGMGKTWLLQMFENDAAARALPHVYVNFGDGQAYDTLTLIRRFRDAFGAERFPLLTEAITAAATPQVQITSDPNAPPPTVNINVAGSTLADSPITVQDVGTVIKDSYFVVQTDSPIVRQALEDRINRAFFDDLAELSQNTMPIFLFDTYERTSIKSDGWVSNEADRWVIGQLLTRMREGQLGNVVVVIAGERAPTFGVEWNDVLGRMSLHPLECADVDEYLRQRRGLTTISDAQIKVLCEAVAGSPQVLGLIGDNLELANNPAARDDEW